MGPRLNPFEAAPDAMKAMLALDGTVRKLGIDEQLYWLVKIRASQINGCAYCIHMHTREGRAAGISEDRMHLLSAWRESPLYSAKERAALAWTDALTLLPETGAPDDVFKALQAEFGPKEIVDLTVLIGTINVWNRIAVGFRSLHPVSTEASHP
ncbi:carboxymuconolactone decarboxylase family protein [Rhizobiaceae sp. 2RAB30]